MLDRSIGAPPRRPGLRRTLGCAAVAAFMVLAQSGCTDQATAESGPTSIDHPSTIAVERAPRSTSTTIATTDDFTEPACRSLVATITATPGGGSATLCESGWAVGSLRSADSTTATVLFQFDGTDWVERGRRQTDETFAIDELDALGMPTPLAESFGTNKPWLTDDNLLEFVKLLGTIPDVHTAIADPCSLITLLALDLPSRSFTMTTNDTNTCVTPAGHTLIDVVNGVATLKVVSAPANGAGTGTSNSPANSGLAGLAYNQALEAFGDSESIDITICGDPVGGDICVSGFAPTPPERSR